MTLTEYIEIARNAPFELLLGPRTPSKQFFVTTKKLFELLPYWYGIKPIRYIWKGAYSAPDICYNRIVVNAHEVEEIMFKRYNEYCEEEEFEPTDDGFEEYMREFKYLIVELIYLIHKADKANKKKANTP